MEFALRGFLASLRLARKREAGREQLREHKDPGAIRRREIEAHGGTIARGKRLP